MTAALSTIHSMSAKLNNCMTKVVQLEAMTDIDDAQNDFVQELKSNLEQLNKEKEILIKYIQQQSQKTTQEGIAEI